MKNKTTINVGTEHRNIILALLTLTVYF